MGNRRSRMPGPSYPVQEDHAPRSAFVDPSPLIMDQFTRDRDGSNPAGESREIPIRRSSSYQSTHMRDEEDKW